MIEFLKNIEWTSFISIILGAFAAISSAWIFKRKKDADNRLTKLIKEDDLFIKEYQAYIDKIKLGQEEYKKQLTEKLDINSEYDIKSLEIKTESLKHELELLKLEILKKKLELLTSKLESKDVNEIIEALNQKSIKGQANYINQILHQSGSTEQIRFEEK